MNAPAHPKRSDYEPMVRAFLPTAEGEELQHRASLLLMRDRAMATKPIACEEAWALLDLVERVASREAFRPMSTADLTEVRRLLLTCVAAASSFDSLYAPQLPIGEQNGRG